MREAASHDGRPTHTKRRNENTMTRRNSEVHRRNRPLSCVSRRHRRGKSRPAAACAHRAAVRTTTTGKSLDDTIRAAG
ncbi:hypothetical protein WJ30_06720 [Burkholderia diffusa]|nr:hypothetical protein WJ30_06720 [Burkholderia diffusa]